MTEWQPIDFNDIRKGDRIKCTHFGVERRGVANHQKHDKLWLAEEGDAVAFAKEQNYLDPNSRPPEPEIPVGAAGHATVRGVENVRVMRLYTEDEDGWVWVSASPVGRLFDTFHDISDVTDFVPDGPPSLLTADEIRAEERERIANLINDSTGNKDVPIFTLNDKSYVVWWLRAGAK